MIVKGLKVQSLTTKEQSWAGQEACSMSQLPHGTSGSLFFFFFFFGFFETGFLCVALAVLELSSLCRPGWPRTQKFACLCLPSAGIKGMRHHARLQSFFLNRVFHSSDWPATQCIATNSNPPASDFHMQGLPCPSSVSFQSF
jgi:hypothetical protein